MFGNAVHRALEKLASLPEAERTRERLLALSVESLDQASGWSSAAARASSVGVKVTPSRAASCSGVANGSDTAPPSYCWSVSGTGLSAMTPASV